MSSSQQAQKLSTRLLLFLLNHSNHVATVGVVLCAGIVVGFALKLVDANAVDFTVASLLRIGAGFTFGVLLIVGGMALHEHEQAMRVERVVRYVESLRDYTVENLDSLKGLLGSSAEADLPVPEAQVADVDAKASEKALGERERTTYLLIVGVLCEMAKLPIDQPSKVASVIASEAELKGWRLPERTVSDKIRLVRDAIGRRSK